ncbi:MAG: YdgA family protein [Verrucomicrobia bacterium]|nr:YdgA family protein [Verrucomicrobiota bacterium]
MKKFLILIPVVLLALWVSITWFIGSSTKSGFTRALEEINNNLGAAAAFTSVTEESYSRGFLSSEAVTKITGGDDSDPDKKDVFLKIKAWHGPLMMTPDGLKIGAEYVKVTLDQDRLPEEFKKIIADSFNQKEPFEIDVFTGFGGKTAIDTKIAAFTFNGDNAESVKFEGLSANLETNIQGTFAKGKINIGSFSFEDKKKGNLLSIATATGEMDFTNMAVRMAGDGSAHLEFPEIKVINEGDTYAVKALRFGSVSARKEGKIDMTSEVSVGGFKGPDKGPYADVFSKMDGKLEMKFASEGMDAETLKLMLSAQQKMQKSQADDGAGSEAATQALHDYMIAVSQLLKPGYKMKNHIAFTNKSGESKIDLGLEYTGTKPLFDLGTINDLLAAVEIALDLQIAKDLIPAAGVQQIQPAIAMGFVLDKGAFYKGGAILAGGELTVNGKESPVLKQMGPMLNMPIPWESMGIKKSK